MSPLTLSRNQHLRLVLLLPVCLSFAAFTACTPTEQAAIEPRNKEVVRLKIQNDPSQPGDKIRIVGGTSGNDRAAKRPRRVCYDTAQEAYCETVIEYRWSAPYESGVELSIEYKKGVYWDNNVPPVLHEIFADQCFTGFLITNDGRRVLTLTEEAPAQTITLRDDAPCGLEKVFFFYDVKCKETQSGACDNIEDLDPGTLLDNGRR